MTKRTRHAPAKRAIIIGMDGASMELVKNMIDCGHAPNMAKLLQTGGYRPTLCYLLGLPMPDKVEGGVVYEALADPNWHLTALAALT